MEPHDIEAIQAATSLAIFGIGLAISSCIMLVGLATCEYGLKEGRRPLIGCKEGIRKVATRLRLGERFNEFIGI